MGSGDVRLWDAAELGFGNMTDEELWAARQLRLRDFRRYRARYRKLSTIRSLCILGALALFGLLLVLWARFPIAGLLLVAVVQCFLLVLRPFRSFAMDVLRDANAALEAVNAELSNLCSLKRARLASIRYIDELMAERRRQSTETY